MKRNTVTSVALYALVLLMLYFVHSITTSVEGLLQYGERNYVLVLMLISWFGYFFAALYILLWGHRSLIKCITLALMLCTLSESISYLSMLSMAEDIVFFEGVIRLALCVINLILVMLYISGFRQNSRRLMIVLGIQAYLDMVTVLNAIHVLRDIPLAVGLQTWPLVNALIYLTLIVLLSDRRVSDLSYDRAARDNGDRLFSSLGGGSMILLSNEDFVRIISTDRSDWGDSVDPAVEKEATFHATELRGGYEIIAQKFYGSDNVRLTFHRYGSVTFFNQLVVDVVCTKEIGTVRSYRKVRFFGKEGFFIDLLVESDDPKVSQSA